MARPDLLKGFVDQALNLDEPNQWNGDGQIVVYL